MLFFAVPTDVPRFPLQSIIAKLRNARKGRKFPEGQLKTELAMALEEIAIRHKTDMSVTGEIARRALYGSANEPK
jgi:hypothetical protein